jgi:hypothetical protein
MTTLVLSALYHTPSSLNYLASYTTTCSSANSGDGRSSLEKASKGSALQRHFHHAPIANAPRQFLRRARPEDRLENLGCAPQTVREAIHDFNGRGLLALQAKSSRPKRTRDAFGRKSAEQLREMLHRSPREFGYQSSLWILAMASEAAFEEGLTQERVSGRRCGLLCRACSGFAGCGPSGG